LNKEPKCENGCGYQKQLALQPIICCPEAPLTAKEVQSDEPNWTHDARIPSNLYRGYWGKLNGSHLWCPITGPSLDSLVAWALHVNLVSICWGDYLPIIPWLSEGCLNRIGGL